MIKDAQGNVLTGATSEAASLLDEGVRAFMLSYGDTLGALDKAIQSAPAFAMAYLAKAWVLTLANDTFFVVKARTLLDKARALEMNDARARACSRAHPRRRRPPRRGRRLARPARHARAA